VSKFAAFVLLSLLVGSAFGQLTPAERQGLSEALYLRNLTLKDLDFVRRDKSGPALMAPVAESLDHPLDGADVVMRLHKANGSTLSGLLANSLAQLQVPLPTGSAITLPMVPDDVPGPLRDPVGRILGAMQSANDEIRAALAKLTADERQVLLQSLPQLAAGPSVPIVFAKTAPAPAATVDGLMLKVDLPRILAAGQLLSQRVEAELPKLKAAAATPIPTTLAFAVNGIPVELSGNGRDVHQALAGGLCIDLGGDNVYTGRYGAGVEASSVLIDLGGNSTYDVPDLSIGAGLLGVGLAYDMGGESHFRGHALNFGAGIGGIGALMKVAGDDTYSATAMAQGFGDHGIGVLLDTGGSDQYRIAGWGQGSAQEGGVGWLVDRDGNDVYIATGLEDRSSRAQGYGRNAVGLLTDLAGNDTYLGTSRCQGVGDHFGLGSLYDAAGRDTYTADHAAQGFASDSGVGFLFDLAGDDMYTVRGGSCQGTAQGRSVAMLFDRDGDDVYASGDGRPGLATDGSAAIFLDANGQDRYFSTPSGSVPGRFGDALGIFVDMAGEDGYTDGLENGQARIEADGAVAYDNAEIGTPSALVNAGPRFGSIPNPGNDAIDALAAQGTEAAADRLFGIGAPAYDRLVANHLAKATSPIMTAIVRIGHQIRGLAHPAVTAKLQSKDPVELRRALYLAESFAMTEAGPRIVALVKDPAVQREAIEAAGLLRLKEALPDIVPLATADVSERSLIAALAIERIGDESSIPAAQALVTSTQFPVRQAALRMLAHFVASGTLTAQKLLAESDERLQRIGIELLGRMGTPESLATVGVYLGAKTPGMKIQALTALEGHCPPAFRAAIEALRYDPNPAVRAVAARIDPGR